MAITSDGRIPTQENTIYRKIKELILENDKYKNSKLFCFKQYSHIAPALLPYLEQNGVVLYDNHNNNRMSYTNIKNAQNIEYKVLNVKEFINYLDSKRENYFITNSRLITEYESFNVVEDNIKLHFDLVEAHPEFYTIVFKIRKEIIK